MTDERQKKTTEEYRSNWDTIFRQKIIEVIKHDNRNHREQDHEDTPRTNS